MNNICFISDFFAEDLQGGAELVDAELIRFFEGKYNVKKIRTSNSKEIESSLSNDTYYIISNFIGLNESIKKTLKSYRYSIYEHDHKYLSSRDPTVFEDFRAPPESIINKEFYKNAENVFCQSKIQSEVAKKNLQLNNIINLGCSLWSDEEFKALETALETVKTKPIAILKTENQIKGRFEAVQYCKQVSEPFESVGGLPYGDFLKELAQFEKFVFLPAVLESFSRLAIEARILSCQLITNNNLGCASEEWFSKTKGRDLLDLMKSKKAKIFERLESIINREAPTLQPSLREPITVILNSYRRPYNLKMQVEAIRNQTLAPSQIWLWVNDHEENRDFDYSSLGVDRIFRNDYNWKFYGRFAAALLSDTEYVAIFDDDTIPGKRWFENCMETMKTTEGILGSAGVILNDNIYMHHNRVGWPSMNTDITRVDLVGHAWFFKRDWLQYLWKEKPTTWDNGEDIQFSYLAQKYGNIQTFCPPHPPSTQELHGSILGNELGIDDKATSTNSSVSHEQFFSERDFCVQTALKGGWETVKGVTL